MANSRLINRKFVLPDSMIYYFNHKVPDVAIQVKNFIDKGYLTYYDMKNFIKDYPSLSDEDKVKHGGETFYKWVNGILNQLRKLVKNRKKNSSLSGQSNAFIKPHNKNFNFTAHTQKRIY